MPQPLQALAQSVAQALTQRNQRIVFAESCTAGLVSATLARIPGISEYLCGSAVVYRLDTKAKWLGVPEEMLINPGPVSESVARAMALGALSKTPEADIAASVTGHLGPNAPGHQDGLVFVGLAERNGSCQVQEYHLPPCNRSDQVVRYPGETEREQRQWNAVDVVLTLVGSHLRVNPNAG